MDTTILGGYNVEERRHTIKYLENTVGINVDGYLEYFWSYFNNSIGECSWIYFL